MGYILLFLTSLIVYIVYIVTFISRSQDEVKRCSWILDSIEASAQLLCLCIPLWQSGYFFCVSHRENQLPRDGSMDKYSNNINQFVFKYT